jgi:hypothetical protein
MVALRCQCREGKGIGGGVVGKRGAQGSTARDSQRYCPVRVLMIAASLVPAGGLVSNPVGAAGAAMLVVGLGTLRLGMRW